MNNEKIGSFISELRKSKNMTQKELAEKLNITDKAVSKWERGMGYPEITTVPLLAELLGVSVSELLRGEHIDKEQECSLDPVKADAIVADTVQYVQQSHRQKTTRTNAVVFAAVSVAFLISLFICFLCNFVSRGKFDWSLYVLGSELTAWLILTPLLTMKKHRIAAAMAGLTLSILPLLFLIESLCPAKNWVIPFALPIVLISVISLWITVFLFSYTKISRIYLAAITVLQYGVIIDLVINRFVGNYLHSSVNNISVPIIAVTCGFAAVVLFIFGFVRQKA